MSIEKAYNSWAEQYDSNDNKTRDLDAAATIATLSKYDFSNVLELGCGTGKNTAWLLKKADRIIGLDFSDEMLNHARRKIDDTRVDFMKADLNSKWNVGDEFADLITSSLTLEHIENLGPIFQQAASKLKVNGLFYICELHPFKQYRGSQAKFKTEDGVEKLEVYTHHVSDYTENAAISGFEILEVREWFDDDAKKEIPRLISFVFRKV